VPVRAAALVAVGVLACLKGAALADDPPAPPDEARVHFDTGAALATLRKYEEAAREFKASYELDPRKEALFAWAQVERLGGNCPAAVELYRRFLASADLTPTQIEAAELNVRRCQSEPKVEPAPPPAPIAAAATIAVAAPPPVVVTPARSRRAVVAGAVLLGGAVACAAASVTFYLLSRNDESTASSARVLQDYYDPAHHAIERQRLAAGLLGAGVLLGGGALLEWLTSAPRAPRLAAWIDPRGVGAALAGRY
jgi:hypothetical protein